MTTKATMQLKVKRNRSMSRILIIILTLIVLAGCSERNRLKDFTEKHRPEQSFVFYPSTLRMVNLENNQDFNDMIQDIEKGKYFSYPVSDEISSELKTLEKELTENGYEEILELKNKEISARVFLLEKKTPILTAFIRNNETINILELEGMINPVKIPKLMENFNDEEFLNILNIGNQHQNNPHIEHTEDQQPQ